MRVLVHRGQHGHRGARHPQRGSAQHALELGVGGHGPHPARFSGTSQDHKVAIGPVPWRIHLWRRGRRATTRTRGSRACRTTRWRDGHCCGVSTTCRRRWTGAISPTDGRPRRSWAGSCDWGLLNPASGSSPGSPWWRAVNDSLLRDTCLRGLGTGLRPPRRASLPRRRGDPRVHPAPHGPHLVPGAQRDDRVGVPGQRGAARAEDRVERFFLNLVLVRVLFAHAMVAQPRLALGWLAPLGRGLGDPRLGMTSILFLSRVLPDDYPLGDDLDAYVSAENSIGHLLDVGVIVPRLGPLYEWSARGASASRTSPACSCSRGRPPPTPGTRRSRPSGTRSRRGSPGRRSGWCPVVRERCARRRASGLRFRRSEALLRCVRGGT